MNFRTEYILSWLPTIFDKICDGINSYMTSIFLNLAINIIDYYYPPNIDKLYY